MYQPSPYERLTLAERLRTNAGRRGISLGLALLLEALLILLLLTLGEGGDGAKKEGPVLTTFDASDEEDAPTPEEKPQPKQAAPPTQTQRVTPQPPVPPVQQQAPTPPLIQLPRDTGPKFDISQLPREPAKPAPPRPMMGPPAPTPGRNDSPIVGRRANGQPIYAAQWYREPTHQELAGYLSTADGPGWGLIVCRTAPDYRVEDCEFLDEYPANSHIARAALAAAWQFKVRPPRKGNTYLVGEWVRIRLDLTVSVAPPPK